jgi:hypothetical protein
MIIIHSRNRFFHNSAGVGPLDDMLCIIVPPDADPPADDLFTLAEKPYIFEYTSAASSVIDTLRSTVLKVEHIAASRTAALKYLGEFTDQSLIHSSVGETEIQWNLAEDGEIEDFVCGEGIVGQEIFLTFFRNMAENIPPVHVETSLKLFQHYLGPKSS